ncbi:hypothetical protein NHX12_013473 [Muraenolepis orangiensis]|uniref:Uncharacterized protein n=1 Tax=Muraenolepis orangiensis TaxID=630683 RepID=A0A9Q0I6X6_9TELE|nr:hypothetical protein NHX12_013473 [Muraenolepis orangiensis]
MDARNCSAQLGWIHISCIWFERLFTKKNKKTLAASPLLSQNPQTSTGVGRRNSEAHSSGSPQVHYASPFLPDVEFQEPSGIWITIRRESVQKQIFIDDHHRHTRIEDVPLVGHYLDESTPVSLLTLSFSRCDKVDSSSLLSIQPLPCP